MYFELIFPIIIFLLIFIQGFFANSEMAMVSSNKIHFKYLASNGNKNASIIQNLLNNPDRLFGTTLLGINLATVTASVLADKFFEEVIFDYINFIGKIIPLKLVVLIVMEPIILVFGELFPMSMARKFPNTTALRNAKIIRIAYYIMFPFMSILSFISRNIAALFKVPRLSKISREELELLVTAGFADIDHKTKKYIKEVFNINQLIASDIMVHIDKVKAISEESTVEKVKLLINETNHSRIPVYRNQIFNIVGTIHVANLLGLNDDEPIKQYTDKLYIIPSTKPIIQILKELKQNRKYMGIVVNEYGLVNGILTLKDILKEIIGDISDNFNLNECPDIEKNKNIFKAHIRLDEFYEQTNIDFRNYDVDTLAGIINLALGRIAKKNEIVTFNNIKFEIIDVTDRTIKTIRLIK